MGHNISISEPTMSTEEDEETSEEEEEETSTSQIIDRLSFSLRSRLQRLDSERKDQSAKFQQFQGVRSEAKRFKDAPHVDADPKKQED